MAYSFRSVGTIHESAASTSHTLTPGAPAGLTAGDLVLLSIWCRGTPSSAVAPTGFTLVSSSATSRLQLWGRIATGTGDTPSISVSFATNIACNGQYAAFSGAPASMASIAGFTTAETSSTTSTGDIVTAAGGTPSEDNCLIVYTGLLFTGTTATALPNSSTIIEDNEVSALLWTPWSYSIQTTAANVGASEFSSNDVSAGVNYYSRVAAFKAGAAATTKYLKMLVHPSAIGQVITEGIVLAESTSSPLTITGSKIGEIVGGSPQYAFYDGDSDSPQVDPGYAVIKIPVADFGGESLTTSSTPLAVVRNATYTTGLVSCTVVEE